MQSLSVFLCCVSTMNLTEKILLLTLASREGMWSLKQKNKDLVKDLSANSVCVYICVHLDFQREFHEFVAQ